MKTKLKDFEKLNLDLRKIGDVVLCIKNYNLRSTFGNYKKDVKFKKGNYYKVDSFYGDPQGALEIGINDYLPVEFISRIVVLDENGTKESFKVHNTNNKFIDFQNYNMFFEHFKIVDFEIKKYNL